MTSPIQEISLVPAVHQKNKISLLLTQNITAYEKSGATQVKVLRVAAKIVGLLTILTVLGSIIAPIFLPQYNWMPWAGLGAYFVLAGIEGGLESSAYKKERRYEAMRVLQGMLPHHRFKPLTEADLPALDSRLRSDQLLHEEVSKKHPPHVQNEVEVINNYGIDCEIAEKAMITTRQELHLGQFHSREWNSIRKKSAEAKREIYQNHPGPIKKWFQTHFSCRQYEPSLMERLDSYQRGMNRAKNQAINIPASHASLITLPTKHIPENGSKALEVSLKRLFQVKIDLELLHAIYDEVKRPYNEHLPYALDAIPIFNRYEVFREAQAPLPVLEKLISEALQSGSVLAAKSEFFRETNKYLSKLNPTTVENFNNLRSDQKKALSHLEAVMIMYRNTLATLPEFLSLYEWLDQFPAEDSSSALKWLNDCPVNKFEELLSAFKQQYSLSSQADDGVFSFMMDVILPPFPHDAGQEEKWKSTLAKNFESLVQHFSAGQRELREEIEKIGNQFPATRQSALEEKLAELKTLERATLYQKKVNAIEKAIAELRVALEQMKDQPTYLKWVKECLKVEKKLSELFADIKAKPFFTRVGLFYKKFRESKPVEKIALDETPLHPQLQQRKVEELRLNELLSQVDLSIARTNRFRRIFLERVAIIAFLVIDFFVFANVWAGFGITMGMVAIFAAGRLVDYRMQTLQKRKQALRMTHKLKQPVPHEQDFKFEKGWRRVQAGDLETAVIAGNRPQLKQLRDVAGRYGLDGTTIRQSERILGVEKPIHFTQRGKKVERKPSTIEENQREIFLFRERTLRSESKRLKERKIELEAKKRKYAEEKIHLEEERKSLEKEKNHLVNNPLIESAMRRYQLQFFNLVSSKEILEIQEERQEKRLKEMQALFRPSSPDEFDKFLNGFREELAHLRPISSRFLDEMKLWSDKERETGFREMVASYLKEKDLLLKLKNIAALREHQKIAFEKTRKFFQLSLSDNFHAYFQDFEKGLAYFEAACRIFAERRIWTEKEKEAFSKLQEHFLKERDLLRKLKDIKAFESSYSEETFRDLALKEERVILEKGSNEVAKSIRTIELREKQVLELEKRREKEYFENAFRFCADASNSIETLAIPVLESIIQFAKKRKAAKEAHVQTLSSKKQYDSLFKLFDSLRQQRICYEAQQELKKTGRN